MEPPRLSELDEELYEQVSTGLDAHYSEYWLRGAFQEHAQQLIAERQRGSAALGAELAKHTRKDAAVAPSALTKHHAKTNTISQKSDISCWERS